MKKYFNNWFIPFLLVVIITGCENRLGITSPPVTTAPNVISTNPINLSADVALNNPITATFSEAMDSITMTTATFTLMQGSSFASGTVSYNGITAVFSPLSSLAPNTAYVATITTGAKNHSGNSLDQNYVWNFTTGSNGFVIPPAVSSTNPLNNASLVPLDQKIEANFNKIMNNSSFTTSTFILMQGSVFIPGSVNCSGTKATYTPTNNLTLNATYTATITTGAKDLTGNAIASNYVWSFSTGNTYNVALASNPAMGGTISGGGTFNSGSSVTINAIPNLGYSFTSWTENGISVSANANYQFSLSSNRTFEANFASTIPIVVILGTASTFGGFGGSAGLTNQGIFTVINGDIGTTAASTLVTGFHDTGGDVFTETPLNIGQVNGTINCAPPAPGNAAKYAKALQALADATIAFNYLAGLPVGPDPRAGELGALVLAPGTYTAAAGTFKISSGDLTLDAQNNPDAIWVFQMAKSLTVGKAGQPRSIILVNGAQAKNIFWQVGSAATINGAGGGTMAGTIISYSGVTFSTAGNVTLTTLNGRALSLNASVTLVNTIVNLQ
jgi:hypothetical protein